MVTRTPGACMGCIRSKRKCDHRLPRCTNCIKRDIPCHKKQFKQWKLLDWPQLNETSERRSSPSLTEPEAESAQLDITEASPPFIYSPPLSHPLSIFLPDYNGVPDRIFLWQYFVERSSHIFQCWGESIETTTRDPLSTLLPAMAAFDGTLRSAALAFSAHYFRLDKPDGAARISSIDLFTEAIKGLVSSKDDVSPTSDSFLAQLAAILLLYRVDSHSSPSLLCLARSAVSCITTTNAQGIKQDSRYRALLALLAWTDICTYSSVTPQPTLTVQDDFPLTFSKQCEEHSNFSPDFDSWITHPIYAFSRNLISPLLCMSRLVQARRLNHPWTDDLEARACSLEVDLLTAYEENLDLTTRTTSNDPTPLLHANTAMFAVSSIMFYTRLRDTPLTASFIRHQVARVLAETACIDSSSVTSRAAIFPLFIAGCEAVDYTSRTAVKERLGSFVHYLGCPLQPMFDQLENIWRVRDAAPGLTWLEWTSQRKLL
ncbi:hypothetical protein PENFLA_c106G10326 [Penicillium flavigenum]|uniref:Zn(2)-C6 fungal-type domain-containing protein n=1 Tax=Penicillium flavigenum TaxID=254877 RepID=A0A1V6S708_9EURO|nr:hypothetical protein PENFLA_c106G10326 [Penicillium flavigenum]